MPHFRVELMDGTRRHVEALKMTHVDGAVVFVHREPRTSSELSTVCEVPAEDVVEVRRRVTEHNGSHRWIRQRAVAGPA